MTTNTTTDPRGELAAMVRARMGAMGLNVTTTAAAAGITHRESLSAWLHGRRELTSHQVLLLTRALGIGFTTRRPHPHRRRRREGCGCC